MVITAAAALFGVGRLYYGPRAIQEADAATIGEDMTTFQVRFRLGPPHHVHKGKSLSWGYAIEGTIEYLDIRLDGDRVVAVERVSYIPSSLFGD